MIGVKPLSQLPKITVQVFLVEVFQMIERLELIQNINESLIVLQVVILKITEMIQFPEMAQYLVNIAVIYWKDCRLMVAAILAGK